jgi:microtubule-associated protein-like 6
LDKAKKDQTLFGCGENKTTKGHTDDIISLGMNPERTLVATGETGKNPKVYIWSAKTGEIQCFYKCKRVRGIKTIGWSKSSKYVGFSCLDNDHTVYLVDPHGKKKCKLLGSGKGGPGAFFDMAFSTVDEGTFVTIGKRSKYWTYNDGMLTGKQLIFGKQKRTTLIVGTFTGDGTLICGGSNGRLYCYSGNSCTKTIKMHKGPVFAINCTGNSLITAGKDKTLKIFNNGDINSEPTTIKLHHYARGLDQSIENGLVLVGGRDGVIYEYDYNG